MKETLLLYHVADDVQKDIKNIAEQLHIQIQYLDESQLHETMGHILNIDGFEKSEVQNISGDFQQEFVFFAGMSDKQLDIILQLFRMQGIPKITYKAMLTEHNVHYKFYQLYLSVADEYQQLSQINN